jgi:hypothetical protein
LTSTKRERSDAMSSGVVRQQPPFVFRIDRYAERLLPTAV